uniref:Uncharacterized protein n=1 Tax=Cacopsylla melanoneura TaxID=428564 RepID=A0A8D8YSJ2_9HEMI
MNFNNFEVLQNDFKTKEYDNFNEWSKIECKTIKNNDLIIIHINIKSLSNKNFNMLKVYLEKIIKKIDIIVLTEINCKNEEMQYYGLENFNMTYKCREKRKGGGILIYTKQSIQVTEKRNITFKQAENIEIEIDNKNLIINAIYRPPKTSIKEFLL